MTDDDLDVLLNRPLTAITDGGFSGRVMARIARRRRIEAAWNWSTLALCGLALLAFLPVADITRALIQVASAPGVVVAAGILVLVWAWEPRLFRL